MQYLISTIQYLLKCERYNGHDIFIFFNLHDMHCNNYLWADWLALIWTNLSTTTTTGIGRSSTCLFIVSGRSCKFVKASSMKISKKDNMTNVILMLNNSMCPLIAPSLLCFSKHIANENTPRWCWSKVHEFFILENGRICKNSCNPHKSYSSYSQVDI